LRLIEFCQEVGRKKRRAFAGEEYWARPVSGFGDSQARLVVVGLAPAAHGANRTGRLFTGDDSGDWLWRALHSFGFASRAWGRRRDDGLELWDCYVTAALRCAPPANRPTPGELDACRSYLEAELRLLERASVFIALGRIAFGSLLKALSKLGLGPLPPQAAFGHGRLWTIGSGLHLLASYHPSRQNTQTGRLTRRMFHDVFGQARDILEGQSD
jgi:uracil-DNA glycosylase family 4